MTTACPAILDLGPDFYAPVTAAKFPQALPRFLNTGTAATLGWQDLDWSRHFHRFEPLEQNLQRPLALCYHGHQFRHYNPDLGDGRGFLFAQILTDQHQLLDLGTKGSGQTPFSRAGDGRLTLKGAFREALATELLESLGVNTSKTFCFFETGESLERNDEPSPTRAAVLTRLSHGHIRIGTFQRLAFLRQTENIKKLLDYCVHHYYPHLNMSPPSSLERAAQFLHAVSLQQAALAAQYMMSGFVHGVLNSDNMNITGESFDYGPYRFLPEYNPNFTAAYFDSQGLYCYGHQPNAIYWNLQQLAGSLSEAFPELLSVKLLEDFGPVFSQILMKMFFHRLNIQPRTDFENDSLFSTYFQFLTKRKLRFEQTFFDLFGGLHPDRWKKSPQAFDYDSHDFKDLQDALKNYVPENPSLLAEPYFQNAKPCTLLLDEIETLWTAIELQDDWSLFEKKIAQIRSFRGIYRLYHIGKSHLNSLSLL